MLAKQRIGEYKMKLGILSYERQPLALDGRDWQNIGDYIQSYAMRKILEELELTDEIESVSKFELSSYDGNYIFLIMNSFNNLTDQLHLPQTVYPISEKIIPCYISYHLASAMTKEVAAFFRSQQPIGCRDEYTMQNMRRNGVKAYITGCVTALLPRSARVPTLSEGGKILFVDTPDSLDPFVPKELEEHIERLSAIYYLNRTTGAPFLSTEEHERINEYAIKRMEYYQEHAALVVTSRLHVASPCMAMGIPVIFTADNIDECFTWIDKFLPMYSRNDFQKIDWNPAPLEYEQEKTDIKNALKSVIQKKWKESKEIFDLSSFYENRKRFQTNDTIRYYLQQVPIRQDKPTRYVIWGTVNKAEVIKRAIDQYFPHWKIEHAIDLHCKGYFDGIPIESPEIVDSIDDDVIFVVVPASAYPAVSKLLDSKGKKYILVDYTGCSWSEHIEDK